MLKKLDILVLKAFFWPFIATFFITLFVFMMQILWKYIDDLVGKGLDMVTLLEFLVYASATLVTLAMPISILLSSIMTFGKLGENFELVALKSSGISLLRFMRPLFFVSILLSGVAFLFANYIAPLANLKFAVIYHDIYQKSPAFDLKPGVFYDGFQGYAIKVGRKENDSVLHQILIYERSGEPQDNTTTSKEGIMTTGKDKQFLTFKLEDGHRYEETRKSNNQQTEFIDLGFKEYIKLFDLSQLNMQNTPDSLFRNNIRMKSMRQLGEDLDSLVKLPDSASKQLAYNLAPYISFASAERDRLPPGLREAGAASKSKGEDSLLAVLSEKRDSMLAVTSKRKDSVLSAIFVIKDTSFDELIPNSLKRQVFTKALGDISNAQTTTQLAASQYKETRSSISEYRIEWHKKLSLSIACIVLFFIGAPIGSIIRKGGLGMPLVMALIFFMVFYLLDIFGAKFAKDHILTPFVGVWLPVIVLSPVGFFLSYKAMHDSQLFNKEFYYRVAKRFKRIFTKSI